jgi:hypothetical protein
MALVIRDHDEPSKARNESHSSCVFDLLLSRQTREHVVSCALGFGPSGLEDLMLPQSACPFVMSEHICVPLQAGIGQISRPGIL